jgi:hypothetical protein
MAYHHSFDTKLEYATDSGFSSALTEVTGVITVSGFEQTVTKTATHYLRVTGGKKTYTPGLIDSGDISAECDYDETVYAALEVLLHARSTTFKYWRLTLPGSSTLIGQGFVSMLNINVPDDDRVTYTLTVTPSAGWDFTSV